MKNIAGIIIRLACIAALFAAASCAQEARQDSVRMSDTAIVLEDGELSYQFEVVANAAWTLTCVDEDGNNPDWFSVTPSSGNGTTKVTLNIISTNPDMAIRTGKIVAVCGDKSSEATVTQRGVSRVISFIDPQVVAISSASATSGRFTLVLSSKGATVTAKLPSDASWLSNLNLIEDVETGFSARKTWTFDVAPNNMSDMRSAVVEVTVSAKGKTDRYSVRVEQSGQGAPSIKTPDVIYMGCDQSAHSQPFWVEGSKENLTYLVSCSSASADSGEAWITDARVEDGKLLVSAVPNTSQEAREGSIYIVGTRASGAGNGESTALSVKVYQSGHSSAGIQMAASEVTVGYAQESHFVSFVLLNGSKVSGSPEANVPWITDIKASDEGRLTYAVSEYDAPSDESDYREGIISFKVGNGASNDALASLKVRQYSSRFTNIVLPSELSLQARSASAVIPFDADGGKLEVVDSGTDWLKAACVEDEGLSFINVTASDWTAGEAGSPLRSGLVTLKYSRNERTVYHYVNVYQYAPTVRDISMSEAVNLNYDEETASFAVGLRGGGIGEIICTSAGGWIRSAAVSGTGDIAEITVKVDKWTTATAEASSRSGMLCIPYTYDGLTMYHYVQINQRSQVFTDIVLPSVISLQAKSASATIPFDAAGGKLEVVDNGGDWLAATSGEQGGLTFVKLAASDWAAGDADTPQRSALVTLKYTRDGMSAYHYVTVAQTAPIVRDITVPAALNLDYDDEKVVFELGLRGGRIGDIGSTSSGDWIRSAVVRGTGDIAEITVKVDKWTAATAETSSRSGLLCIPYTNDGLTMYHYVQVNQKSQAFKDIVLPDEVSLPAKWAYEIVPYDLAGGTLEVLKSEVAGDWLLAGNFDFDGDSFLMVAADDWTVSDADSDFRSGLVVLKYSKNGMSAYHYMTVRQYAPKVRDTSMPSALSLNYDETSTSFMVALNGGGIGTIQCSSQDGWIKNARANVNGGNAEIVVEVEKWNGSMSASSDRTGIICIPYVYDGFTMYHYVQVSQKPEPFADIRVPVAITLHSSAVSSEFYLDASRGDVSGITSSADWLDVRTVNQNGVCSVTIRADAYSGAALSRSCLLSIPYRIGTTSVTYYVTVTQFNETMSALTVPPVITLSHSQTSAESAMTLTGGVSALIGVPKWTSEGGWLTEVTASDLKLTLTARKWEDAPSTSVFRQGDIVIPFTRGDNTVYYHALAYQYSKDVVGIDIPSELRLKAAEVEKTIPVNGAKGSTLEAEYDGTAAPWIKSVTASPSSIVIKTSPGTMSIDGEPSRSAGIKFTYTVNGIITVYNMTVTQEVVTESDIVLNTGFKVFRHFNWSDPEESERSKVKYTSFKWLDTTAKTLVVEGTAIGLALSYDFKGANLNVNCSDNTLFESIGVTECQVDEDHLDFKLTFKNPNFSQWDGKENVKLTFNVGEGKTMEYPLDLDVYNHKPDRLEGLQDCVPDVGGKDESQFTSKTFSLDNFVTPESERYSKFEIQGVFADKECSTPLSPTQINSVGTASDGRNCSIKMSFDKSHTYEAGYLKGVLSTESGKSETISIPYRLYPVISQKPSLPALNKVAFALDELVTGAEYWDFQRIVMSPDDHNNGKVSVALQGNHIVFGWEREEDLSSRYVLAKLLFTFKKNSFGDEGRISQKELTIRLDYQNAPELLKGVFTVGSGKKVQFTRSNLAYIHNIQKFVFRDSQIFPPIGNARGNAHPMDVSDDKDLFYWSSENNHYGLSYIPLITWYPFVDWGSMSGSLGERIKNKNYRTMTSTEWINLMNRGAEVSVDGEAKRHQGHILTNVCGLPGMLFLPDKFVWNTLAMGPFIPDIRSSSNLTAAKFSAFEEAGAVWLPIPGYISNNSYIQNIGVYWTSQVYGNADSYVLQLSLDGDLRIYYASKNRDACSVRLVRDY